MKLVGMNPRLTPRHVRRPRENPYYHNPTLPGKLYKQEKLAENYYNLSDTASGVWDYFKPMIPWFILTNLVTAVVVWKIASLVCSGRAAVVSTKEAIGEKLGISR